MKVIKRDKKEVEFDSTKIEAAIKQEMLAHLQICQMKI